MKTVSFKLPESLHRKLQAVAKRRGESQSEVVRAAIEQYFDGDDALPAGSLLERAGKLVGCLEGPGDLSYNKKHMEGFGE